MAAADSEKKNRGCRFKPQIGALHLVITIKLRPETACGPRQWHRIAPGNIGAKILIGTINTGIFVTISFIITIAKRIVLIVIVRKLTFRNTSRGISDD